MAGTLRALRRRILTPNPKAVLMTERGFHIKNADSAALLEQIGGVFLAGYAHAAEARTIADAEAGLEQIPVRFRGFGYEGAGMGFTIRDGLPIGGSHHFADFLAGRAKKHEYMAWVGLGWGLARLPRFRWRRFTCEDPLMRWLVLDGYGFHQAFFKTEQYVRQQYREAHFPWPGGEHAWYAPRAIDQGIGRAMWFVCGTDPDLVADTFEGFDAERRADLYAGAGLAATYAGGVDEAELRRFWQRAGQYQPQVAQGAAFAGTARYEADLVVPHTELALNVFCGMTARESAELCDKARPSGEEGPIPAYEVWRQQISEAVAARTRS
ncbi:hypothetical protein ABH926_002986 [Catenulispora sp. GP43]|uniref:DUF1702 family protein n=1 Tax=Catenulispora sp. GP43 TaxID=3156263 RepID=UPI0035144A31